jgi:hypothetical protein
MNNNLTRFTIIAIILIARSFFLFAQEEEKAPDTMRVTKVMLIPFDERYYLSDADREIMEQSKITPDKFRSSFRQNVDRHVQRAIGGSYPCISLLNDTADALEQTLYKVLSRTGYRYEKAIPIEARFEEDQHAGNRPKKSDPTEHQDSKTAVRYIPMEKDAKYMHAVVSKAPELFKELSIEYDVDYFVFLTQLDIKTNYNSCLDIANKIYRREVKLHFTIYNRDAKVIAGSYATSFFPSNTNHPNTIIGECFPELGKFVAGCLP